MEKNIYNWLEKEAISSENFNNKDELLENVYEYTRTKLTLQDQNTEINTKFWRDLGSRIKRYTYIWQGKGSLDSMLKGWIDVNLKNIFVKFLKFGKKLQIIKDILSKWLSKVNFFFKQIWKKRNKNILSWEKK